MAILDDLQKAYPRLLGSARKKGDLDADQFERLNNLMLDNDAVLEIAYQELIRVLLENKEKEMETIYPRLVKGAQIIEQETDSKKKERYMQAFNALSERLEKLKSEVRQHETYHTRIVAGVKRNH